MLSTAIVLGPQRRVKTVCDAVDALVPDQKSGAVVAITAGWEEREAEDDELCDHVGRPVQNLAIWSRVERIFAADPELLTAMRERHARLRKMQALYRMRLEGLMDPLCELHRREDDPDLLEPERQAALELVRTLDRGHETRVAAVHEEFESRIKPGERDAVVKHRRELDAILRDASCLLVAGGHVAVLLHRMRLFDVMGLWGDRPVIAWSAGAMVLTERIVLFHDAPPQGSNYPEVMERGFGCLPGFVALPHARHRLQLDDERSMEVLARRFAPALAALLVGGSRFNWDGKAWAAAADSLVLSPTGTTIEVKA